jgi:SPFH domain / Band 7 family
MLDRLRATFWSMFWVFGVGMTGVAIYVTVSTLVKHFQISWYVIWICVAILFVIYQSVHLFFVEANYVCIITRFGKEYDIIDKPGFHFIVFGLFLTRVYVPKEMRVRVHQIKAMTNNFIGCTMNVVIVLERIKGVPKAISEIESVIDTQVRVALLTLIQTMVWDKHTRFNFKGSVIIPALTDPLKPFGLIIKSIDIDNIEITNIDLLHHSTTTSNVQHRASITTATPNKE